MNNRGYFLIEVVLSISIIPIICLILYNTLFQTINTKEYIENKNELKQQALEVIDSIEYIIQNSKSIINDYDCGKNLELKPIKSIKCEYKDEDYEQNKEIIYKSQYDKIFINDLNKYNQTQSGGYEIGNYITNMYIGISDTKNIVKVKIKLQKENTDYEIEKIIKIHNFKENRL